MVPPDKFIVSAKQRRVRQSESRTGTCSADGKTGPNKAVCEITQCNEREQGNPAVQWELQTRLPASQADIDTKAGKRRERRTQEREMSSVGLVCRGEALHYIDTRCSACSWLSVPVVPIVYSLLILPLYVRKSRYDIKTGLGIHIIP